MENDLKIPPYFLKKCNYLFDNFAWTLWRSIKCLIFAIFCPYLRFPVCFFDVPLFLQNYSIASHYFFIYLWYYSEGYPINETSLQHLSLCWEPFWGIFGFILRYAALFLWRFFYQKHLYKFSLDNILRDFVLMLLYYPNSHSSKKNFTTCIPLLAALCNIFGPILDLSLNVLRNLKHFLDILRECLDITVVVTN